MHEKEMMLEFSDNQLLQKVVGSQNQNLQYLETIVQARLNLRGNIIAIGGRLDTAKKARHILNVLYNEAREGVEITPGHIDGIIRMMGAPANTPGTSIKIKMHEKPITPRTPNQAKFIEALQQSDLVFGVGPAGTGKTYLAVAMGVSLLMSGQVDRLVLCRPAVEAGEKLGFLPGDLKEKVDPFLRPIYDALEDMFPKAQVEKLIAAGNIEIAPLAFMRGRTLSHSYVILDEAQNSTVMQMKMFLTRLGEGSKMVVTGDVTQIDLPHGEKSGLIDAQQRFKEISEINFIEFDDGDVVRHPLVGKLVKAYNVN